MLKQFASVGALTLVSRITGFLSGLVTAQILGAGKLADAFMVASRIPNHFRAIFAEGAFNAAYIPSYTHLQTREGQNAAQYFASQIFTLLVVCQLLLLILAEAFMPEVIGLLAPGYDSDPQKFAMAVTMTHITFPYLGLIVLTTLHSATLNANGYFTAAAFAPVLLNVSVIGFLLLAFLFPNAGIAASFGVLVSGVAQLALVALAARRAHILEKFALPAWGKDLKQFFKALVPAVIGSAGVQIAIFADTIIASTLGDGSQSYISYADRLYQLPIGLIGIAAGTVLLPELSRRLARGDEAGAFTSQSLTMAVTIALAMPFCVAFLVCPDLIVRGAFRRGAFTDEDSLQSAKILWAYSLGLMAVVLIRSAVASFQARSDLKTPMIVSLVAVAINVACKIILIRFLGPSGLAMATSIGAIINFTFLTIIALQWRWMKFDRQFFLIVAASFNGAVWLFLTLTWLDQPLEAYFNRLGHWSDITHLAVVGLIGAIVYLGMLALQLHWLGFSQFFSRNRNSPNIEPHF